MTTATPTSRHTDHRYAEMARCAGFGILTGLTIMLVVGVLPAPALICTILCYAAILLGITIDSRTQDTADHDLDYGHRAA